MEWLGNAMPDLVAERVLEGWEVPKDAWERLLRGQGADQVHEVHDALRAFLPLGTANRWMTRSNDKAPFEGQSPMVRLLRPGGMAAIHRILVLDRVHL